MTEYHITVSGKVQGVWFRKYTREKALELGLVGYVMNLANSDVYIEVQGEPNTLVRFKIWLKEEGSPLCHVTRIQVKEVEASTAFTSFTIKR